MAILDRNYDFSDAQALSTTSDVLSTNVLDAGAAVKKFAGSLGAFPVKIACGIVITAGTGTLSYRARLVGADDAGLSTNAIILDDTGVQIKGPDGATALANTDVATFELSASFQGPAKRYYGVVWTLGGTSPTATGDANGVIDSQSNHPNPKAAVP